MLTQRSAGESCALGAPTYSNEHAAGMFCSLAEHFAGRIVGQQLDSGDELQDTLAIFKGNQFAKYVLSRRPGAFYVTPVVARRVLNVSETCHASALTLSTRRRASLQGGTGQRMVGAT
jgi:hypothetical protein